MSNKVKKEFKEEVWFLYGIKINRLIIGFLLYQNSGTTCGVEFNLDKAFFGMSNILRRLLPLNKKKCDPWLRGFYHTHPGGDPLPSPIDDRTMSGWVKAMGRPMLCGIISGKNQGCFKYLKISNCPGVFYVSVDSILIKRRLFFGLTKF